MEREGKDWRFSGALVARLNNVSLVARYEVTVDSRFKTRSLLVEKTSAGKTLVRKIELRSSGWFVDEKKRADLKECTVVDIEASPVTNTIPIRGAKPKVGERVDLTAVWVRVPSLLVSPLKQSYERLGARRYRYRSASGFTADLEVDDFGLVTRYGNIWVADK